MEIRIEDLQLEQREVNKKKVSRYKEKYEAGIEMEPISVSYCVHTGRYMINDGHHRTVASYLAGKTSIASRTEPCYIYNCSGVGSEWALYSIRHTIFR